MLELIKKERKLLNRYNKLLFIKLNKFCKKNDTKNYKLWYKKVDLNDFMLRRLNRLILKYDLNEIFKGYQ